MKIPSAILVLIFAFQAATRVPAAETAPPAPATNAPASAKEAPAAPKIVFAEREFEYGRVMAGEPVKHDFWFTNTGNALLVITSVSPGCGCTTAGAYSSEVAPGRSGVIPIRFDTSNYNGPQTKNVTVMCNDKSQVVVNLLLKGTVVVPVEITPPFVALNVVPDATSNATAVVLIHNNTASPMALENPVSNQPGIVAELKVLKPGQDFELTIHTVAQLITNNAFAAITLKTSSPIKPLITVSAVANFLPALSLMPAQIVIMQPGQSPGTNSYRVTIVNNSAKPLSVVEPTVNISGAQVAVEETEPGKRFSVNLTLPAGFEIPTGVNYGLSVKTSNPQFALINFPIRQIPRAVPPGAPPVPPQPTNRGNILTNSGVRPMVPQPLAAGPGIPSAPSAANSVAK